MADALNIPQFWHQVIEIILGHEQKLHLEIREIKLHPFLAMA